MALRKYDTANSEQFVTPIRGLYPEHVISIEDFKDHNVDLMKNHWIDTTHSSKGEKIYELFEPDSDGEIVKESMQEWVCDNRHQITECISIALRNHEFTYAEWFKYVDAQSGPDELALYSLARKYGIHTSVYNKGYVWTTLMNHVSRTDEEIFKLSGVNLVYLGPTVYGIIREIRAPQPGTVVLKPGPPTKSSKHSGKTTCRDSSRSGGRKHSNIAGRNTEAQKGTNKDRPKTLSEKRRANYGISDTNITTRKLRTSMQPVDYVSLNDGYDEEEEPQPRKKRCKESYRPRSAPSASRISANRTKDSPNTATLEGDVTADKPLAIPSTSAASSVPVQADITLPDLVVNRSELPETDLQMSAATNTVEDLEAANTLLSLGDSLEDTLEEDDDNTLLMPIGGANNPEDIAPEPIRLDRYSVDNTIAELIETEELKKSIEERGMNPMGTLPAPTDQLQPSTDRPPAVQPLDISANGKKGTPITKTYVLKKPAVKRSFKCSECNTVKQTIQKLNKHHQEKHNPQMCGICNRTFELASSLTHHMYEHEDKRFKCDSCDYSSHFASELEVHKIVHRTNPSHQCMHANCGKWFRRKWDLSLHLQKHKGIELKCDHDGCTFTTATKKQLKEHQKRHTDDYPHECKICHKGFKYRSGLKRHRDKDHKDHKSS